MKIIRGLALDFVPASHEDLNDPGVLKKVLLKRDQLTEGRIQMINWAKLPVGKGFRAHYQEDMEEVFIIISGSAWIRVDSQEDTLLTGDAVVVPIGAVHEMKALGDTPVLFVAIGITKDQGGKTVVV